MTKEKQVEEMAKVICLFKDRECKHCCQFVNGTVSDNCCYRKIATILTDASYGNVNEAINQALTEFVRKLKERAVGMIVPLCDSAVPMVTIKDAEKLLKEFSGEDK